MSKGLSAERLSVIRRSHKLNGEEILKWLQGSEPGRMTQYEIEKWLPLKADAILDLLQHIDAQERELEELRASVAAADEMANAATFAWKKLYNPGNDPSAITKAKNALRMAERTYRATRTPDDEAGG